MSYHHHWINPQNILWEIHLSFHFRQDAYLFAFLLVLPHSIWCTCVFRTFASFSVSLDLVWQPDSLINMHGWVRLRTMRPDQVVLTLFVFEIFKQCNQMAVAGLHVIKIIKRYKMVARKYSQSFQNLRNSWMFSSMNDSQYTVVLGLVRP